MKQYEYLWTVEKRNYVLIRSTRQEPPILPYVIYHKPSSTALVIEDDAAYTEVVRRMLDAGVEVVDRAPD